MSTNEQPKSKTYSAFTTDLERDPARRYQMERAAAKAARFAGRDGNVTTTVAGPVTTITGTAA